MTTLPQPQPRQPTVWTADEFRANAAREKWEQKTIDLLLKWGPPKAAFEVGRWRVTVKG